MTALQCAIVELSPADVRLFEERLENENLLLDLAHRLSTRPLVNQNASPNVEKSQKLIPSYKTYYLGSVNDGASTSCGIVDAVSLPYKHQKSSQFENFLSLSVPEKLNKRPLRNQNVSLNVEEPQKLIPSYKTLCLGGVNEGASTSGGIVHAVSSSHTPPESLQLESSVKESRPTTTTTIVPTEHNQQFISSNAAFKRYTFQKFIYAILQSEKDHFQAVQVAFNYFDRHFPQLKAKLTPKVTSHGDDIVSIINSFNDDEVEEDIVVGYKPYHLFDYIEKSKSFSQKVEERFLYYQYYETSNFNRRARVIDCFLKSNKEITPLAICKEKSTNNDDEINFSQNLQREPSRLPNFEFKEPSESVMLVSESTGTPANFPLWYLEVKTYKQEQSKNEKTLAGFDYYMTPLQILASKYRGPPTRSAMQFLSRLSDADISEAMKNLLSLPEILNDPEKANGKGDVAITTTANAESSPSAAVAASLPTTAAQPKDNRTPSLQQSQPTPVNPTPLTTTIERVIENGSQKSCETVQVMPKGKNQIEVIDLVSDDDYDSDDSYSDDSDYSDSDSDDIIFVKEVINNPQKEVEKSGPAVAVAAAAATASVAAATTAEVAATGAEVSASDHSEVTSGGGHEVAKEKGEEVEEEEEAEKAQDVEKTDLSEPSPSPSPLPLPLPPPANRVPVPTAVIPPDLMAIHSIATTEFVCRRGGGRPFRSVARQRQMIKIERLPANFHFISRLHDLVPSKKHERFINQFTPRLSRLAPLVPTKQEMRKSRELKAKMKRSLAASAAARAKKGGASAGQSTSSNKRPYLIGTRCSSRISAQQAAAAFFDSISKSSETSAEQETIQQQQQQQPTNGRQQRAAKRRLQPDCPSNSTDTPANSCSSNNGNGHEESGPSRNKKRVRFAEDLIQPAAAATPTSAKPTTAKSKRPAAPPAATKSTAGKGKRPASKDSSTATKSKRPAALPAPTAAAATTSSSSGVEPEAPETEAPVVANNNNNNNIQKQKPKPKHQSLRPPPRTFDPAEAANVAVDRRNYSFHCLYPGCSHKFSSTLYFEATEHVRMQHFYASTKTVKVSELLSDTWEHPAKWVHTEKRTLANG